MSFSANVKEEISNQWSQARHCQIAELAALTGFCGCITVDGRDRYGIKFHTENRAVARKVFTLIKKTFNIETNISVRRNMEKHGTSYSIVVNGHEEALRVLRAVKVVDEYQYGFERVRAMNPIVTRQPFCKRAFLRGAFLAAGSMSDPNKSYHFEIVCGAGEMAARIQELMRGFSMDAKVVQRKKAHVVYLKEGEQIVDMLNIMEAHISLMQLENVRIIKEMRNAVNRKVNCETANINKTVFAAVKQVEDITYLRDTVGLDKLPEGLEDMALARLSHPDATLKELGELMSPPVGKSGVNHRLRKIGEMADKVRESNGSVLAGLLPGKNKEGHYD